MLKTWKKINLKASIIGLLSDMTFSWATMFLLILFYEIYADINGIPTDTVLLILNEGLIFTLLFLIISLIGSILGGFITGVISKKYFKLNAAVLSFLSITFDIIAVYKTQNIPTWDWIFSSLLIIPAYFIGALLAQKYLNKK